MRERITYIDLAKGISMGIVMLFHIRGICPDELAYRPKNISRQMWPIFYSPEKLAHILFRVCDVAF